MLRRILNLMISLSMLTAAVPAAFAAPETPEGESAAAAAEVTETEVLEETEPETADMAETPVPELTEAVETAAPEEPEAAEETAAPEPTETAAEPGISLMSVVSSGTCGDDLTWTLDDSGTLTISGTGEMTDYDYSSQVPWDSSRSSIKSVVIEDGVTYIGSHAFRNCDALTSITIPDSVTSIGSYAFRNCDALTSITIPDSVTSIGEDAFYECHALTSITIPDSVTFIGEDAFAYCDALTSISIPDSVTSIGDCAFRGCDALTDITIPDSVTFIGNDAFYDTAYYNDDSNWENGILYINNCLIDAGTDITECTIKNDCKVIADYAFDDCSALTDVYYDGSLSGFAKISIGSYNSEFTGATLHCADTVYETWGKCGVSLAYYLDDSGTLTISGTGEMADYRNSSSSSRAPWYSIRSSINAVVIEDGVTSIGNYAFYNCSALTDVYYSSSLSDFAKISIGSSNSEFTGATLHCGDTAYGTWGTCGNDLAWFLDDTGTLTISGTGAMSWSGNRPWNNNSSSIKAVVIEEGVTSIGNYAFEYCSSLTSVTIGSGVTSISRYAFNNCNALTNVYITDVAAWCGITFDNSYSNPMFYAENIYVNGELATELVIPDGVTSISSYAFYNCDALTSITIPNSVTSIGSYAFSGCSSLTSVTLGSGVTSIGSDAFEDCSALESLYISDLAAYLNASYGNSYSCPMYYADRLYLNNVRIVTVEIPDGVTSIPDYAFNGCDGLRSVTIPSSVTSIGYYAFGSCTGLTNVYISDIAAWCAIDFEHVASYSYYAPTSNPLYYAENLYINNDAVTDIVIPDGVTAVSPCAFYGFETLASVTVPDSVTSIGAAAFYDCTGLTDVSIGNGVTSIGSDAFESCSVLTGVYITDLAAWCAIDFDSYEANPLYYAKTLYVDNEIVTDLVIPDGITSVSDYAFYGCSTLTSVTIPDSVTAIGGYAFRSCTGLTSVSLGSGLTTLGNGAFRYCSSITDIMIPYSVTSIGEYAFANCSRLTGITIPQNVASIGTLAFGDCTSLTELVYNAADCELGSNWFGGYYNYYSYAYAPITTVTVGDTVQTLPANFLSGCSTLLSAVLPDSVTAIDTNTFYNCTNLRRIYIPRSVTEIEQNAFSGCSSLIAVEYGGTESDWDLVYIGSGNELLTGAQVNFNSLAENAAITDADLLTYTVNNDNTLTITSCYQNAVNIDIPAEIDGMPVTAINSSAFANRTNLESVTIPASVTAIGTDAFRGCTALSEIVIPDGVASIANSAFYGCSSLENITIPASVTSIESYAFYGCTSLTDVYYAGSEEQWAAVSVGYSNTPLTNAAVYYNGTMPEPEPTPLPMTTAEITKTDTETGYVFEVIPEAAYENCYVYAAVYDENGVLIALSQVPLSTAGSTSIEVGRSENDSRAAVFIWADTSQPIVTEAEFSLI